MIDLGQYIAAVKSFDNISAAWKTQALIVLTRECQAAQEEFSSIQLTGEFLNIQ